MQSVPPKLQLKDLNNSERNKQIEEEESYGEENINEDNSAEKRI